MVGQEAGVGRRKRESLVEDQQLVHQGRARAPVSHDEDGRVLDLGPRDLPAQQEVVDPTGHLVENGKGRHGQAHHQPRQPDRKAVPHEQSRPAGQAHPMPESRNPRPVLVAGVLTGSRFLSHVGHGSSSCCPVTHLANLKCCRKGRLELMFGRIRPSLQSYGTRMTGKSCLYRLNRRLLLWLERNSNPKRKRGRAVSGHYFLWIPVGRWPGPPLSDLGDWSRDHPRTEREAGPHERPPRLRFGLPWADGALAYASGYYGPTGRW